MRKIGKMRKISLCEIGVFDLHWAASMLPVPTTQYASDGQLTKHFS